MVRFLTTFMSALFVAVPAALAEQKNYNKAYTHTLDHLIPTIHNCSSCVQTMAAQELVAENVDWRVSDSLNVANRINTTVPYIVDSPSNHTVDIGGPTNIQILPLTGKDDNLVKAATICHHHEIATNEIEPTYPPQPITAWAPGWEDCSVVQQRWNESEHTKAERERALKETADHDFIESFVKNK